MGFNLAASIIFKFYFADFFSVRRASRYIRKEKMRLAAGFAYSMRTSPINFGLLGGNGNSTLKLRRQPN